MGTLYVRVKTNYYPTTWANLPLTCKHVGEIWNLDVVDVIDDNGWFARKMTNRHIPWANIVRR